MQFRYYEKTADSEMKIDIFDVGGGLRSKLSDCMDFDVLVIQRKGVTVQYQLQ